MRVRPSRRPVPIGSTPVFGGQDRRREQRDGDAEGKRRCPVELAQRREIADVWQIGVFHQAFPSRMRPASW
jgi:hypothetical protein